MAGLVAYESSDEEEEAKPQPTSEPLREIGPVTADADSTPGTTAIQEARKLPEPRSEAVDEEEKPTVYGPQIGPLSGPIFPPLEEDAPGAGEGIGIDVVVDVPSRPGSPYTATRALLRDLTLPAVADMDIPPSPPGSPPAATSRKFETFLELKKKGVHFNARLADTPSMMNPALADKLMAFAELDHRDAYRTTLPRDLWDPDAFPRLAYKERLRQSQSDVAQARVRAAGEPVKFVPSEAAAEDGRTAQGLGTGKRKTRFDT